MQFFLHLRRQPCICLCDWTHHPRCIHKWKTLLSQQFRTQTKSYKYKLFCSIYIIYVYVCIIHTFKQIRLNSPIVLIRSIKLCLTGATHLQAFTILDRATWPDTKLLTEPKLCNAIAVTPLSCYYTYTTHIYIYKYAPFLLSGALAIAIDHIFWRIRWKIQHILPFKSQNRIEVGFSCD